MGAPALSAFVATIHRDFPAAWTAELLAAAPPILPAQHFVYPRAIAGEEQALSRGALFVQVKPASAPPFLATCPRGFREPSLPSGVWSCPRAEDMLAVAGGYAYLVDTTAPENCVHLPMRPVTAVFAAPEDGLLLLADFHTVMAVGAEGLRWTSRRLSWEGVVLQMVKDGHLHGLGWNMMEDREVPFALDLKTGRHTGGGFNAR